jgi:hypothetical protein
MPAYIGHRRTRLSSNVQNQMTDVISRYVSSEDYDDEEEEDEEEEEEEEEEEQEEEKEVGNGKCHSQSHFTLIPFSFPPSSVVKATMDFSDCDELEQALLLRSERPPTTKRRKERTELQRKKSLRRRKRRKRRKRKKRDLRRPPRHQVLRLRLPKPRRMLSLKRTTPLRWKGKKTKTKIEPPLIPFHLPFLLPSSAVDWGRILPVHMEAYKSCAMRVSSEQFICNFPSFTGNKLFVDR